MARREAVFRQTATLCTALHRSVAPPKFVRLSRVHLILSNSSGFRIPESVNPHRERPAAFIPPTKGFPKSQRIFRETFELLFPASAPSEGVGQRPFLCERSDGCIE